MNSLPESARPLLRVPLKTILFLLSNIVSTFGVLYGASDAIAEAAMEGSAAIPGVAAAFTKASAFAYMAFNLLCMPCFAAVGAIKKEMGNWKDTLKTIGFQMLVAWIVAFIVYIICGFIF